MQHMGSRSIISMISISPLVNQSPYSAKIGIIQIADQIPVVLGNLARVSKRP
jgi:hypothetical protein